MSNLVVALAVIFLLVWFWQDSLRARGRAIGAARKMCSDVDVQWLDQTVALARLRPARRPGGGWTLRRWYRFEFSEDGVTRRVGHVVLEAGRVTGIEMDSQGGRTFTGEKARGADED